MKSNILQHQTRLRLVWWSDLTEPLRLECGDIYRLLILVDMLRGLVASYNKSHHRSIKMTPDAVNKDNEITVFNNLFK